MDREDSDSKGGRGLKGLIAQQHLRDTGSLVLVAVAAEAHRLSELSQKGCIHVPVPFLACQALREPRGWAEKRDQHLLVDCNGQPCPSHPRPPGRQLHPCRLCRVATPRTSPILLALGLPFVTFPEMAHFKFLYFLWTEWVPEDGSSSLGRVFSWRPSCVTCRVILRPGRDMRDSRSRMSGTHRLLFEEDLLRGMAAAWRRAMDLKHPCSIKQILAPQCLPAPSHPSLQGPRLGPRMEPLQVCNEDTPIQAQALPPLSLAGRLEVGGEKGMQPARSHFHPSG